MNHSYYSPKEAAEFLNLAPLTLANWRSRGVGPAYMKFGEERTDRIIYKRRDLELWRKARDRRMKAAARKDKAIPKPRRIRPISVED